MWSTSNISNKPSEFVIEFINGQTFKNIKQFELIEQKKLKIIFELLCTFHYLHENNFIYRDLKLNNIILDKNQHVILIDFDRIIEIQENDEDD